jgi:hypothetical protein
MFAARYEKWPWQASGWRKNSQPWLSPAVVRAATGSLVKCMDQVVEGFTVQDRLREMLLCDESENAELFSPEDRRQLLHRLLSHLVLGGPMCQYEEELTPYVETVKRLYKSLLAVQKNPSSGKVEVTSVVYAVTAVEAENWCVRPALTPACGLSEGSS